MTEGTKLPRVLGLRDLILLHVVAIVGLRWLLTAGRIGPSAVVLWLAAVLFFFIPQGLAVLELSSRLPEEGGIYVWTREAFGPLHGFICGWTYWVNNLIYYPALILFIAGNAVFVLGQEYAGLADNVTYLAFFSLVILWLALGFNIIGLRTGRWVQNSGAIATGIIVALLLILAGAALAKGVGQNPMAGGSMIPTLDKERLGLWSTLCFALAGLELAAVMGGEVRDPARSLPRSILVASPIIAAIYIAGTLAVLAAVPSSQVNIVTGVVEAIAAIGERVGVSLARLVALLIVVTGLGGVGAWLAGTARIPFVVGLDRFLPRALGKVHPRWETPYVALAVQGIGASVFIIWAALGATVEEAYLVLVDTTIIVYFIPYIYLFLALIVLRRRNAGETKPRFTVPGGTLVVGLVALSGLATTVISIMLSTLPTEVVVSPAWFITKVIVGATVLTASGLVFYFVAVRRSSTAA